MGKFKLKNRDFGIKNLMLVIASANFLVFVLSMFGNNNLSVSLALIPSQVMKGEIWRLISYIFIPPTFNPFFFIFSLMFYYYIGRELEYYWGTSKFNLYYFLGVIIISTVAMIFNVPVVGVSNLNLSLFLAYAIFDPNRTVYLFMAIPVKMKYLAIVSLTILVYQFLSLPNELWRFKIITIAPILNFLLFFVPGFVRNTSRGNKIKRNKEKFNARVINFDTSKLPKNKCHVCNRTEKDDENLEFRYCSKCKGNYQYCSDHIFSHEHIED